MNCKKEVSVSEGFTVNLATLSFKRNFNLGLGLCKEFHADYEAFVEKHKCYGNPGLTKIILTALERSSEEPISKSTLKVFAGLVDHYLEELIHFSMAHAPSCDLLEIGYAIHALESLYYTLSFLQTGNAEMIGLALEFVGEGWE